MAEVEPERAEADPEVAALEDDGPAVPQPLAKPRQARGPGNRSPEAATFAAGGRHQAGDLLIGLGNTLRGDDGIGPHLAQWAQALWPALRVRCVQQLTPELAEDLALARRVLFIDAWRLPPAGWVAIPPAAEGLAGRLSAAAPAEAMGGLGQPVLRALPAISGTADDIPEAGAFSHRLEPPQLLVITALLHGRAPQAWLLLVPGFRFGHGEGLSTELKAVLPNAEAMLRGWCSEGACARQVSGEDPQLEMP